MDENERKEYEVTAKELRAELKQFEGDWAKQNGGSKPSRGDIKNNPEIGKQNEYLWTFRGCLMHCTSHTLIVLFLYSQKV